MSPLSAQVSKLVDDFVSAVAAVARQAAMETLTAALSPADGTALRRRVAGGTGASRPTPTTTTVSTRGRAKGEKRGQAELAQLQERLADFVRSHPGLRVEQINEALGTKTSDVARPLRKLIDAGVVRSEGAKRSTQYFPAAGAVARSQDVGPRRRTRA